jgi:hypothetical protein
MVRGARESRERVTMQQSGCRASAPLATFSPAGNAPALQKIPPQIHSGAENVKILGARDFDGPEFLQVGRKPLRVQENELSLAQMFHEGEQGDLGGVPDVVKHRLAEEGAANRDAVEATGEPAVLPRLNRVGVAELVETSIAFDDLIIDPRLRTSRALLHDLGKGNVDPDFEGFFSDDPLKSLRDVEFLERKDRARIRGKPSNLAILHRHRKNAEAISLEQDFRINHGGRDQ